MKVKLWMAPYWSGEAARRGAYGTSHPYIYWFWVPARINRRLLIYWRPTMCKAQWELQDWDLFTILLSSFLPPKPTKQAKNNFQGPSFNTSFYSFLWKSWGLEVGKWYHRKYSGLSRLHLAVGTANSHFLNELFLYAFSAASTAVPCIYYTLNEYLSVDFVQICDSINILWKMRSLGTKRVRIPFQKKSKQKGSGGAWLKVQMPLYSALQSL